MSQLLLTQSEAALKELGIACQSASRYYHTAASVTHDRWSSFAAARALAYRDIGKRIAEELKREDVLPGTPDEDLEWLKEITLRAQAVIAGDEEGMLLRGFARAEHRVWNALGEFGHAGVPPMAAEIIEGLANHLMGGFLWLGREKEALLKEGKS
ncbi:hypothetical protein [Parvibaculum sp.]|jgi:hypothetical protein|uniref:hypothetical protein n=1 Tax=Parvibaculum sp. TaxID=2024848 RepID=UPI003C7876C7